MERGRGGKPFQEVVSSAKTSRDNYELGLEISACVYVYEMLVFGAVGGSRRIHIMKAFVGKPGLWKVEEPFEGVKLKGNVVRS